MLTKVEFVKAITDIQDAFEGFCEAQSALSDLLGCDSSGFNLDISMINLSEKLLMTMFDDEDRIITAFIYDSIIKDDDGSFDVEYYTPCGKAVSFKIKTAGHLYDYLVRNMNCKNGTRCKKCKCK